MSLFLRATFFARGARSLLETDSVKFALKYSSNNVKVATSTVAFSRHFASDNKKKNDNPAYLIYEGALSNQIRNIKAFSLTTSFFSIFVQSYVYWKHMAEASEISYTLFLSVGAIVILTPVFLHQITKKYVVRIIHRPKDDMYTAMVYSLFLRTKKIDFQPKDVTIPTINGMFTSCKIKGYPMFMDPKSFIEVEHYEKIMGYDKPIDFKLGVPEGETKQEAVEEAKPEICTKKESN